MSKKTLKDKKKKTGGGTQYSQNKENNSPQGVSLFSGQAYHLAMQNFKAGKLQQAEQLCQQLLNSSPDNAEGNYLAGLIAAQQGGKDDIAIEFIRKTVSANPDFAEAHKNLGIVFHRRKRMDEAIASYRKALSLEPDYADIHNNLGNIFQEQGMMDEAVACYRQALSINPDYAKVHNNLGVILQKMDKLDEAIASFEKALVLNPNYAEALNNLGFTLHRQDKVDKAIDCYRKALFLKPDYAEAYNNLGLALIDNDKKAAIANFQKAIFLSPGFAEAHNNLGHVLLKIDRFSFAEASLREAIALNPAYEEPYNNLGLVYYNLGILDEALSCQRKALQLKDDYSLAHSNLLFMMNYHPQITQQEIFKESLNFAKKHITAEARYKHLPVERDASNRKLRIGYVSPDFRTHSVSYFFKPLLEAHSLEKFEIHCYSDVEHQDEMTGQIEAITDHWTSIVKKDDEEVIAQIIKDRIDILVDLAGHTRNNRLKMFAHKPAPIQVSWLGYPNTTGIAAIDYRLTDVIADPTGVDDEFYSEELIRLKDCFLCYQPNEHVPEITAPPFVKSNIITFGSFNNLAKINSEVIKVWSRIMLEVPDSKLILKARQLKNENVGKRFLAMFAGEGISSDRIELLGTIPGIYDHLALYNRIDIALDPFPYNGTTTTCEALWMGVPVVTLLGDRHTGRVGASILHTIDMQDVLLADSSKSYIELAINLAEDKELLTNLRKSLRQHMKPSPLCDAVSFAKKIEGAYRFMWAGLTRKEIEKNENERDEN